MKIEIEPRAKRASNRALGTLIIAGSAITGVLATRLGAVVAGEPGSGAALFGFLGTGAVILAVGSVAVYGSAFVVSTRARAAARALRVSNPNSNVEFAKLAPEFPVIALSIEKGRLIGWTGSDEGPSEVDRVSPVERVTLTSQKLWGLYYYALEVSSGEHSMMITIGTRNSWGMAAASRRTHLRVAQQLLG